MRPTRNPFVRGRGFGGGRRGNGGLGFLLLLRLYAEYQRIERKPPVTVALIGLNLLIYFAQGEYADISIGEVCLQPSKIVVLGEWWRLITSAFFHANEYHLYYNMSSLLMKGLQIEQSQGSVFFGVLVCELLLTSHFIVVGLAWIGSTLGILLMEHQFWATCAVGFSAVLFGLKYILTFGRDTVSEVYIPLYGMVRLPSRIYIPTKYLAWVELLIIQLVMPNASFIGHLAGIVAGILHIQFTHQFYPIITAPIEELLQGVDVFIQSMQ